MIGGWWGGQAGAQRGELRQVFGVWFGPMARGEDGAAFGMADARICWVRWLHERGVFSDFPRDGA